MKSKMEEKNEERFLKGRDYRDPTQKQGLRGQIGCTGPLETRKRSLLGTQMNKFEFTRINSLAQKLARLYLTEYKSRIEAYDEVY